MSPLTTDQLELLQRARDGLPMWGASFAIERLRRELELLFALKLLEAANGGTYRPTVLGERALRTVRSPREATAASGKVTESADRTLPASQAEPDARRPQ